MKEKRHKHHIKIDVLLKDGARFQLDTGTGGGCPDKQYAIDTLRWWARVLEGKGLSGEPVPEGGVVLP